MIAGAVVLLAVLAPLAALQWRERARTRRRGLDRAPIPFTLFMWED